MSLIEKIQNLLDLSRNNPSEEEAATAAAMAAKLMAKHNIEEHDLGHKSDTGWNGGGTFERDYWRLLAQGVGQLIPVSFTFRPSGRKLAYQWVGTKLNCQTAEQVLHFWAVQVEQLYKAHLPRGLSKKARAEFRKNFKRACAAGIIQRARQIKMDQLKEHTTGTALMVVEDELMKEVNEFLKDIPTAKQIKVVTGSGYGTNAGFHASSQVQMQEGME
mgnify:CR=1 FL=1